MSKEKLDRAIALSRSRYKLDVHPILYEILHLTQDDIINLSCSLIRS